MKKILKFLNDYLEETICIILMSVMTIIIFIQVIMRYVMHNSLSWSEELARYCFVWLIYIGVAYGCKLMKHIKIDAALKLFPEKVRPYITIVGELLVLAFAAYIVVTGVELTYKQWLFGKVSPALGVPLQYINAAPVGIAIGVSSLCAILADGRISSLYIVQQLVTSADSFPLMAIPLFILAGELMGAGGVSKRLLNVCNVFLGRFTGGLATVTIVLCMFFAAVSGSGPATVAAIGSMVIPTMLDKGYSKSFTLALIATAGSIGVIIPPSIPMVIYGVSTSTSISSLFMAGFLPGILIGFSLIVVSYLYCKKQGWKGDERKYTAKEKLAAIWDAKWALLNPIIILGGIYAGIFTPTEAAAVAAVYAFICGAFIYREFNIKEMFATIGNACNTTGTTMVIIGCATAFTKILTIEKIPGAITNGIINFTDNKILILLLINVLLLIVGCFMDTTPAMMVLAPILLPIAMQFGVDPIHFGIVMVVNLAIGFITPPLGINLFVASRVGRSDLETVCSGIIKFILVMVVDLLLITFIPAISMTLPNIFMK